MAHILATLPSSRLDQVSNVIQYISPRVMNDEFQEKTNKDVETRQSYLM